MIIDFIKMHGTGNDYIFFDMTEDIYSFKPDEMAAALCDRNFGIGGDGIVFILKDGDDFLMRMWNSDGSEGNMCGNAIRCVARYLYEQRLSHKKSFFIRTISGNRDIEIIENKGKVVSVTVNMGKPVFENEKNRVLNIESEKFDINCLSMGNPHCVIYTEKRFSKEEVEYFGEKIQKTDIFPESVNVEFAYMISEHEIDVQVFERGSGYTLSCGTGASAVFAQTYRNGNCSNPCSVKLPGGRLEISCDEKTGNIMMSGDCTEVFRGKINI